MTRLTPNQFCLGFVRVKPCRGVDGYVTMHFRERYREGNREKEIEIDGCCFATLITAFHGI